MKYWMMTIRRRIDGTFGYGIAYYGDVLPHYRFPDGNLQFLPKYRDGGQGDIPFTYAADADSASLSAYSAALLWRGRGVV